MIPPRAAAAGRPQGAAGPSERPRRESCCLGLLTSMIFSFFFWSAFLLPPAGCCCFLGGMAGWAGAAPAGGRTGPERARAAPPPRGRRNGSRGARWERAAGRPIASRQAVRATGRHGGGAVRDASRVGWGETRAVTGGCVVFGGGKSVRE